MFATKNIYTLKEIFVRFSERKHSTSFTHNPRPRSVGTVNATYNRITQTIFELTYFYQNNFEILKNGKLAITYLYHSSQIVLSFQGKVKDSKINVGSKPGDTRKRSDRVVTRKVSLVDEGFERKIKKNVVHKIEPKKSLKISSRKPSKGIFSEGTIKKSAETSLKEQMDEPSTAKKVVEDPLVVEVAQKKVSVEPSIQQVDESLQVKKGRKRQVIKYEIDCSGINMDTTNFVTFFFDIFH